MKRFFPFLIFFLLAGTSMAQQSVVKSVGSVAALKRLNPNDATSKVVIVETGGIYVWEAGSSGTADDAQYVQPDRDVDGLWKLIDGVVDVGLAGLSTSASDNSSAFNTLAASVAAGTELVIPAGTYNFQNTLVIPKRLRIRGAGTLNATAVLKPLMRITNAAYTVIQDIGISSTAEDEDNFVPADAKGRAAIQVDSDDVTISNVKVEETSTGVYGNVVKRLKVTECRFKNSFLNDTITPGAQSGAIVVQGGEGLIAIGNYATGYSVGLLSINTHYNGVFNGNHIYNPTDNGAYVSSGVGWSIVGNIITNSVSNTAIKVRGLNNKIVGNTIISSLVGIEMSGFAAVPEVGSIDDQYSDSVSGNFSTHNNVIANNTLEDIARHGITADVENVSGTYYSGYNFEIVNNTLIDVAQEAGNSGIICFQEGGKISGNTIYKWNTISSSYGIIVINQNLGSYKLQRLTISENILHNPSGATGIYIVGVTDSQVINNQVTGPLVSLAFNDVTDSSIKGNKGDGTIRFRTTVPDNLRVQNNDVGGWTFDVIPTNTKYFNNSTPPTADLFSFFAYDGDNQTIVVGSTTPLADPLTAYYARKSTDGLFAGFRVKNASEGTSAAAAIDFYTGNTTTASGIAGVWGDNESNTQRADRFGILVNADTAGMFFEAQGTTQNINFNVGDQNTKFQISKNVVALPRLGTKFGIKVGADAIMGTATLVAGTATVATTAVSTDSYIFLTRDTPGGTAGDLSAPEASIVDGTSFVINSSSGSDTSTVRWLLIEGL